MSYTIKKRIVIILIIAVMVSLYLATINFPYTSGHTMKCGFNDKSTSMQIKKIKESGNFYIILMQSDIKISCTKQQYDYLGDNGIYYIRFDVLFYNKHIGKLREISNQNLLQQ